jgi:tRNA(adenine34) deaminase
LGLAKVTNRKKEAFHSFSWHRQVLLELIEHLELKNIVLVVQDWGGLLGLTLPLVDEARYCWPAGHEHHIVATGEVPMSPGFLRWREMCARNQNFDIARLLARDNPQMSVQESAAYAAPFPDRGHRAAVRAFPAMVPEFQDSDGVGHLTPGP